MWHEVISAIDGVVENVSIVVLDLDSTLIHTGSRHLAISRAFDHASVRSVAAELRPHHFGWDVRDPLRDRGVPEAVLDHLLAFWQDRFFTNAWLEHDRPARGAVAFTQAVRDAGAQLVYLTGRPEPTMGDGTRQSLRTLGFPTDAGTQLLTKPSVNLSDAMHKRHAIRQIASSGAVVATFENEPKHANAFVEAFPAALHFLVGDVHEPNPPEADARVRWIRDFERG